MGGNTFWPLKPLGELTENFDSVRMPVKEADRRPGPYPYHGASGVVDYVDGFLFDGEYLLIAEDGENLRTQQTPIAFMATGRFWVNNHAHIVQGNRDNVTRYLMYALRATDIRPYLTGSTMPKLTQANLNRIPVPAPPKSVQKVIAHILGTLDDKIELNRRMNATLEGMARALFKAWFVEGAEEGWEVGTIGDLATIVGGTTPSTKEPAFWEEGIYHWATPKDLSALKTPVLLDTERKITEAGLAQIGSGLLPAGTVLLSSRAPIGYLAIAEIPLAINQGFIAMMPTGRVSNLFLLLWAKYAHDEIVSRANGSTFLEISKSNFRPIPVVAPDEATSRKFDNVVQPIYRRIVENEKQSRTLAALRDALLPRLISGEIRVTG